MSPVARRILGRVVVAAAAGVIAISLARGCERKPAADISVAIDVEPVAGVTAARVELRRGTEVVAWADRRYDGGLTGPLVLRGPALGADGEIRIWLETTAGPRHTRRPLRAPGGSEVTVTCGVDEPTGP